MGFTAQDWDILNLCVFLETIPFYGISPPPIHSNIYFNAFLYPGINTIYKKYMAQVMIILGYHPIMYL